MKIWVDADACPGVVKDILFRAAERAKVHMTLVANSAIRIPASEFIHFTQAASGFNAADELIVDLIEPYDLVITADIPLAALAVEKSAHVLNPRGERYTAENIRERLSVRNFLDELRSGGVNTGGPPALNLRDRQAFANQLDTILTRNAHAT